MTSAASAPATESPAQTYDVIVLGGGPAGENVADYAVRGSSRTAAIVEAELLGGECSYWACMPSKALLRPLDVAETAANLAPLSVPTLDRDALLARRDDWVSHYDDGGQVRWAEGAGLTMVRGHGRLVGERTVEVVDGQGTVRRLMARTAVVLATGSVPVIPGPLTALHPWTTRDVTAVIEVPERLAIVGGGVSACEAARWMTALGSQVTLLVRGGRLLGKFEEFAGEEVADGLRSAGVSVRLATSVTAASRQTVDPEAPVGRTHGGPLTLTLDDGTDLEVDEIVAATGRRPTTDTIGLDTIGLDPAALRGRTHGGDLPPWLFTVGDINAEAMLTHWGKHQARMIGRRIGALAEGRTPAAEPPAPVPQVAFTSPQVASVGLTSAQAAREGRTVRLLDVDYTSAAGAGLLRDDAAGRVRLVVDAATEVALGATFVGPEVAEQLHAATIAVTAGLDLATLRRAVPSYPTASEVWLRLLES
ncbi:NAD(P)/FAD-dependent oxidoreductase [Raineyella sp. LH-20]|uniref:dihydrolipoyl dehydrogenase family protein n=1 Tax=Raineyella sp. LH-20 TaxID=3081204 RepID=UPI0029531887|nr:NAD(P)/FAD-dependent oxidoreductase [Raineyella sp. LH-20]WOP19249.1 NAD(P)/FAD-dependent oxidoreductase [Raineyella sp. LH-20]